MNLAVLGKTLNKARVCPLLAPGAQMSANDPKQSGHYFLRRR
jgi:hypothetical protein